MDDALEFLFGDRSDDPHASPLQNAMNVSCRRASVCKLEDLFRDAQIG